MSEVDLDPTVVELTKQLKDADEAIAKENRDFEAAERRGDLEEGAGSAHYADLGRIEGARRGIEMELARQRAIVEEALAAAAKVTDPSTLSEEIRQAQERAETARLDGLQPHPWGELERLRREKDLAEALAAILTRRQDELSHQVLPGDTGHYDDGHAFGWGSTPSPDDGDTGYYDDGHAFGWSTKKKAVVAGGIVAFVLAAGAAVAALSGGGSSKPSSAGVSSAPEAKSSDSVQSSTNLEVASLPSNTVLAGCIAIDPQGGTTVLHEAFLLSNPNAGTYTATFAKGPTGSVSGTGAASENLVVTDVRIRAFGVYDGLTITGPDGAPIALGPIASQLPLDINAQTDKPNGCDPTTLKMPAAPASSGGPEADHAAIEAFLPAFAHATQVGDVDFLTNALDPAVLARYGKPQCAADLGAVPADATANFVLRAFTSGPEPFTYSSDGQSVVVQNTYSVAVSRTANGVTSDSDIHLSVDSSGAHWFTDCTH